MQDTFHSVFETLLKYILCREERPYHNYVGINLHDVSKPMMSLVTSTQIQTLTFSTTGFLILYVI